MINNFLIHSLLFSEYYTQCITSLFLLNSQRKDCKTIHKSVCGDLLMEFYKSGSIALLRFSTFILTDGFQSRKMAKDLVKMK